MSPLADLRPNAGAQLRAEISLISQNLHLPMTRGYDLGANVDANCANHLHVESIIHESGDFSSNNSFSANTRGASLTAIGSSSGSTSENSLDHDPCADTTTCWNSIPDGHVAASERPASSLPDSPGPMTLTACVSCAYRRVFLSMPEIFCRCFAIGIC
jgi:hypothetical protein